MKSARPSTDETAAVQTVDLWYAPRRGRWVVERLNGSGGRVGTPFVARSRTDALSCLRQWLGAHGYARLAPPSPRRAERGG